MKDQEAELEQITEALKALAHSTRLRIILLLAQQGESYVSQLQEQLNIEQSLLSRHLIKMKKNGLLTSRRLGKQMGYSLTDPGLMAIVRLIFNQEVDSIKI